MRASVPHARSRAACVRTGASTQGPGWGACARTRPWHVVHRVGRSGCYAASGRAPGSSGACCTRPRAGRLRLPVLHHCTRALHDVRAAVALQPRELFAIGMPSKLLAGQQGRELAQLPSRPAHVAARQARCISAQRQVTRAGGSARTPVCTARARLLPRQCQLTSPALARQAARGCAGAAAACAALAPQPEYAAPSFKPWSPALLGLCRGALRCAAAAVRVCWEPARDQARAHQAPTPMGVPTIAVRSRDVPTRPTGRMYVPGCPLALPHLPAPIVERLGPYQGGEDTKPAVGVCLWLHEASLVARGSV